LDFCQERLVTRNILRILPLILLLALLEAGRLRGGISGRLPPSPEKLRKIEREMEELKKRLAGMDLEEDTLLGELDKLDRQITLKKKELQALTMRVEIVKNGMTLQEERMDALRDEIGEGKEDVKRLMRHLLTNRKYPVLRALMISESSGDFLRTVRYTMFRAKEEKRLIDKYSLMLEELEEMKLRLHEDKEKLQEITEQIHNNRSTLKRGKRERENLLRRVRGEKKSSEEVIRVLERASLQLRRVIEGVTSTSPSTRGDSLSIEGRRGSLQPPVGGKIVKPFGPITHPEFHTTVPHDGVDIKGADGTPIKAVFPGIVAYKGWFIGYGNTIIIDHGEGYMSVYSHAREFFVDIEDSVEEGEAIGLLGDTGSLAGPLLYFELRKDGKAVDPEEWFKKGSI
jgi:septal ring factor EnvC (AmiA/AmiB activator)